jgi:hypothetical protein
MTDNTFYQDLLSAQKEIESVDKDGNNPFFKSTYTTLNATIQACKEILNKHNIIVLQPIESDENGVYVCTKLIHTSGDKLESRMLIEKAKSHDPQAQGSAITYARRYSLKSLLTMSDSDDDAEKAMARPVQSPPTPQPLDHVEKQLLDAPCNKCGGKMLLSKNGKPYCANTCWLKNQ